MKKFWIIWKEGCNPNPTYKHDELVTAEIEAERLARAYGGTYFIMESVGGAKKNDVVTIRFDGSDGQPF